MDYQDFTIDLRSAAGGGFEARVIAAPIGDTPQVSFSHPIKPGDLEAVHSAFDQSGEGAPPPEPPKVLARRLGQQLHAALFRDSVAELFLRCRAGLPRDGRTGLRLRLKLRLDDPEAGYLSALPWEWLCDPRSTEFLATDPATPVVRDIAVREPKGTLEVAGPLRILAVAAAPGDMPQLHLERELERMVQALGTLVDAGRVELLRLGRATPDELRDALKDDEVHVLHFMGHAGYHVESGNGALFFVDDDGGKDQVAGEALAPYLKEVPSLRLVVLNACQTARHAGWKGAPVNYGVAPILLERTRVPAVVANQYTISDDAAVAWSAAFYDRIAKGDDVDEALTETRLRLKPRSAEWATPVLFLTTRNGKLFTMPVQHRPNVRAVSRSRPEAAPVRLGVRSILGWGGDMEKRNDAVLDLVQYFDGRYIKEKAWWQDKVFPELRTFLLDKIDPLRPLLLDFAAHSSIAFAAGWVLEPKSGLDVRVRQRAGGEGEFEWHPKDGSEPAGPLWLERPDDLLDPQAPDVALALAVSQPAVADHVREHVRREGLPVGRIVDATIAPEPGPRAVQGGAHALRLAQALLPRLRQRQPHEREGRVHLFCAAPNALVFYLGQLASSLERVVLYEFPFRAEGAFGRYQRSIELPPPGETQKIPEGW